MDEFNSHDYGGSLLISSDVIEKIAEHAVMEVEGVAALAPAASATRSLLGKIAPLKAIRVELKNDVADIEVSIVVQYGSKIPELSERVQQNVKEAVQGMTSISVAKVDVVVSGIDTGAAK
ncbi:MAG: Asp23/Gls24 family envelope stress response protein [Oscillospiraceae bacterium]